MPAASRPNPTPLLRHLSGALLLLPVAACYAVIARMNPELAPQMPAFLLFLLGFVVLPAIGLGRLLVRLPLTWPESLGLGSPAAMALLFGVSYASAALRQPLLVWTQPVLGLAACAAAWTLARRSAASQPCATQNATAASTWGDLLLTTGILAAALTLCLPDLLATSLPTPATALDYYIDDVGQAAYVFSVVRAMEHGLPVWDAILAGVPLSYHLLYHYCYAAAYLVCGAHPMDQLLHLWPPVLWLFLATAVVTGCRRLAGLGLLETAIVAALTLFSCGWGFYSSPGVQLFSYQHSFFNGLPALFLFATALYGHLSGRSQRLFATHAGISFLVCAATKATLMLLLPLALLPVLLVRVFRRQTKVSEFWLAGLCLISVATLKLMIYPDTARVAMRLPALGKLIVGSLGNLWEMAIVIGPVVLFALFAADANPVLRHKLSRSRQYHLFCLAFVVVCAVLLKLFNFIGADFYFYWHARVLVFLACAPALAHALAWRTPRYSVVAALLLLAGMAFLYQTQLLPGLFSTEVAGVSREASLKLIDGGERAGLRWAAANLDRRKVLFTNKDTYPALYMGGYHPLDMYDYLAWSGLQGYAWAPQLLPEAQYAQASKRVAQLHAFLDAPTPELKAQALAQLPEVNYYFHSLQREPNFVPPPGLREVHRTSSLVIYENTLGRAQATAATGAKETMP